MGQEIETQLRWDGRILNGKALLEGESLVFRGDATLEVKFTEMMGVDASSGWLELKTQRGLLLLELGAKAEQWKEKIKNPKALVEKLGVDAKKKVCVVGKLDEDLRSDLVATGAKIAKTAKGKDFDLVFLAAATPKDLEKVPALKELLAQDGALWIVFPKGKPELTDRAVITAGRTVMLTDNKIAKINEELTAMRFVIPVSLRNKK